MRILLVEDDQNLADTMIRVLNQKEASVDWATNFADGEELWSEFDYDVIVSDYEFPGGDGCQFLEMIHNDCNHLAKFRKFYIPRTILWSGLDRTAEAKKSMTRLPNAILVKSDIEELLTEIFGKE